MKMEEQEDQKGIWKWHTPSRIIIQDVPREFNNQDILSVA